MDRRRFVKLGATAIVAGAVNESVRLSSSTSFAGTSSRRPLPDSLPADIDLKTKHAVMIVYGNGARKRDVVGNPEHAPHQTNLASQGTLFTEDFGETSNLHGYMSTELLTGRDASHEQPQFPTVAEYIRRQTGLPASKFWHLLPVSRYGGWTWNAKHFSAHRDYGPQFGATSITASEVFVGNNTRNPRTIIDEHVEQALGHTAGERRVLADFVEYTLSTSRYLPPSTHTPLIDRPLQNYDAVCLQLAGEVLKAFKPRLITVQLLGLDDAHSHHTYRRRHSGYEEYLQHLRTTDELLGNLWQLIQADTYLSQTTALFVRPDCGRDDEVDDAGGLDHSPGEYSSHYVWQLAVGPDYRQGVIVTDPVNRRDVAPTLVYALCGGPASYATGHVRTQMFKEEFGLPGYTATSAAKTLEPKIDLEV